MRYVITDIKGAAAAGIDSKWHRTKGSDMIINEKELMNNGNLKGSAEERTAALKGKIYSDTEISKILKEGGWND